MREVSQDTIEAFASLFKGRTDAHGQVNECVYELVTLTHYEKHLRGEVNLGVYFLLDDSTCHFAAIDLDEKNFNKAKAIRDELVKNSIPAYITESKSKGFHVYCFAFERFKAAEIRRVLQHILNRLNIKAEVFPKQDYHQPNDSDGTRHPGSYINLPCFGYTRPFLSGDLKEVPLEVALERIKFVPQESIARALQALPKEKPLMPKKVVGRRKKHPPCLEIISPGVDEQQRDAAALALARHYLLQFYEPDEVLWLLQEWDTRNRPPTYDGVLLENTVRTAEKYRGSFCSLIKDNPAVSSFCVGDEKCDWPKPRKLEEEPLTQDEESSRLNEIAVKKLLETCTFLMHCQKDAATLPEPHWWSMTHVLAVFGDLGREKIHELSKSYLKYTEEETNQKIEEAKKAASKKIGPHTCAFIKKDLGFDCPKDCPAKKLDVKSPAGMAKKLAVQEIHGPYLYKDKTGWHLNLPKLVDDLLAEYTFKTMRDNEECLVYKDGIYTLLGEALIKEECEKRVPKKFMTRYAINEVIGHVKRSTYADRRQFNREKWILNLENGLYDVRINKLSPHSPKFLSTIRIPVIYDATAVCPQIQNFFAEVLREEDIPVIEELFGYCLIPDYTLQRAFLFVGDGANGKSTLLELLKGFIGRDNCSNIALQALENQRFAPAELFGKLVNIYADLPSTKMPHVGLFKILTGGDTIGGEKKFKDRFSFNNYARLVFSTNRPPEVENEDSLAFWRRWIFINFPNRFEGDKADKRLLQKVTHQNELSGLLNIALRGLARLTNRQEYSYEVSSDEVANWYQKAANPIYAFVEDVCEAEPDAWISKDALYTAFLQYCDEHNIPRIGKESFGKALKNAKNIHVVFQRQGARGTQVTGWQGIKLRKPEIDVDV